jgi:four helix bundle protein
MKVQRFEDLDVWKEARGLVSMVYEAAKENGALQKDYRFRDQINAAAVSVMSNIAEGFWSGGRTGNSCSFFLLPRVPVAEVQSLLYVGLDQS